MAKRKIQSSGFTLSLDSLVDIVSNNVGILIILASFMALFALANPAGRPGEQVLRTAEPPPKRLRVPWSHPTTKNTIYLMIRGNRILYVDLRDFYEQLADLPVPRQLRPVDVPMGQVTARFFPVTNQIYCLEFIPKQNAGETWLQAQEPQSAWQQVREQYPAEGYVYFFWVEGDSFELFRGLRGRLWDEQVEVGWKPVLPDQPLALCNGFEGSSAFQPQ